MRISDWSSDVCSSDLDAVEIEELPFSQVPQTNLTWGAPAASLYLARYAKKSARQIAGNVDAVGSSYAGEPWPVEWIRLAPAHSPDFRRVVAVGRRSEERRVGKECVSKGRIRWL